MISVPAVSQADRIKDLTTLAGARSNQLVGYGLVVGLAGTGDRDKISFTAQSLKATLERLGVEVDGPISNYDLFSRMANLAYDKTKLDNGIRHRNGDAASPCQAGSANRR